MGERLVGPLGWVDLEAVDSRVRKPVSSPIALINGAGNRRNCRTLAHDDHSNPLIGQPTHCSDDAYADNARSPAVVGQRPEVPAPPGRKALPRQRGGPLPVTTSDRGARCAAITASQAHTRLSLACGDAPSPSPSWSTPNRAVRFSRSSQGSWSGSGSCDLIVTTAVPRSPAHGRIERPRC